MNIHSYTIVHYGADFLGYALRSIYDHVDQMHVIYTPYPSHGYQVDIPPVESKERIQQSIPAEIFDKVCWYEMQGIYQEGQQRDAALKICQDAGADIVLVVDCDEVWARETLENMISFVLSDGKHKDYLVNMTHLWRSFNWCCRDENWPVRFINLYCQNDEHSYISRELGEIYHFGYAVRDEIMHYKWQIHGHRDELRPGWLDNEWQWWPPPENCHPTNGRDSKTGVGFWNPEPFDKRELPLFMKKHPFYGLGRIE